MKADTLTLTNLFNRPVTYIVPLFQRPYVWNKGEHWQPLWEDFLAVAERLLDARANATEEELERGVPEQTTPSHFLGAVVLEQVPTGAAMIERRNIIDGQQRLLTLQLFLDAAHDVAAEYEDDGARLFGKLTDNDPSAEVAAFASDPDHATDWYANISAVSWETPEASRGRLPDSVRGALPRPAPQLHLRGPRGRARRAVRDEHQRAAVPDGDDLHGREALSRPVSRSCSRLG